MIPLCSPEVPHPGPCKKRSILQRARANTAASGQNCRALHHFGFRYNENDAPLHRKTEKSDSKRSLGISEGHRWRRRIVCRQLDLQNTPKKCTAHPMGPISAWLKTGLQHPPGAFLSKSHQTNGRMRQTKGPRALSARALGSPRSIVRRVCYLRLPPPSPGRRELPPRLPPRLLP